MPALIIKLIPINVLNVGISLNNKYPINIDQMINEYSNNETTEGEQELYALNIHTKDIEAVAPIIKIYFQA